MGKGGGAGAYPTTKSDSGLWGSSITNGSGTTFSPTQWQKDTMQIAGNSLAPTLKEYLNPSYNSEEFLKTKEQFNKQAQQSYENNVLSSLANRGLMRSSGLQASNNAFNSTLADQEADLMNQYKQSKLTDLSTLLGLSTDLYNYSQGENKLSSTLANSVANYNLQNQALQNQSRANTMRMLMNGIGKGAEMGLTMFSDKRLKKNLVKLACVDGINIYEFEYKQNMGWKLPKGKQIGVIAQEIPSEYTELMGEYYAVNYSKLPELVQSTIKELAHDLNNKEQ